MVRTQWFRYFAATCFALCLATVAAPWKAVAWLLATLAIGIARSAAERRAMRQVPAGTVDRSARFMAIVVVNEAIWAIAPVLAWTSPSPFALPMAFVLGHILWGVGIGHFQVWPRLAVVATAPFALVTGWFLLQLWGGPMFLPALACEGVWCMHITGRLMRGRITQLALDAIEVKQGQLIEDLEQERDHARAGEQAKASFVAMISHELRTPMNGVIGVAQLLGGTRLDETQKDYVGVITRSAQSLLALLNDIIDLTRVEQVRTDAEAVPVDLRDLVARTARVWEGAAHAKGLTFNVCVAPEIPTRVLAYDGRITKILQKLLSNAVKFTEGGSVTVRVTQLADHINECRIRVAVEDTGHGVAIEDSERIFESFAQSDTSVTRRYGGAGLGLPIARKLARQMNGDLSVLWTSNFGSSFALEFPCEILESASADEGDPGAAGAGGDNVGRPLRVLIVEDHPVNRMILERFLESSGHQTASAENGAVALEMLAVERFDLTLMDVNMPVMDGLTATRAVRERDGPARDMPIAIVSAAIRPEDHQAGFDAGADAYLEKPVDFAALSQLLEHVRRAPQASAAAAAAA